REPAPGDTLGPVIVLQWEAPGETPRAGSRLTAELTDDSGIYVAGLAPPRSVVWTVEDLHGRLLVAEDLAGRVDFGEDYRSATVAFELPAALPGGEPLTLALEASDNLGRRSRASLDFVFGGAVSPGPLLGLVYNMPNPTEGGTRFFFEIGRDADVGVDIYTATGRKIVTLPGDRFTPARAREVGIHWDGRDADGDRLANGLYFYRVAARDAAGRREERVERLAVLR
ncbi:MAG: hypothetical protein FJY75_03620, partial [Candidatus Eisenbacteria bacterium]|nr:hypothetical protein [Candidatus Eisenbacteria bacterium]